MSQDIGGDHLEIVCKMLDFLWIFARKKYAMERYKIVSELQSSRAGIYPSFL
jgi:hypothetical protein